MSNYIAIIIAAVLTNNFVLSKFYGCCPFLGVSKKLDSSVGMGAAVVFVMLCASLCTYPIYYFILKPLELTYLRTVAFILVIAVFVQLLEMVIKKLMPPLYKTLGVYPPLITTNCAVLGVTIMNMPRACQRRLPIAAPDMLGFMAESLGTCRGRCPHRPADLPEDSNFLGQPHRNRPAEFARCTRCPPGACQRR